MLGRVERTTDFTFGAAPTTFALGAVPGTRLQFWVEEQEMIFVDGADVANGANGLIAHALDAGDVNLLQTSYASRIVRLAPGLHTMELRIKVPGAGTGVPTVAGATIPCELIAMRNSHIGTLAHGVDSKALLIQ
jgi:hypothetical protein